MKEELNLYIKKTALILQVSCPCLGVGGSDIQIDADSPWMI